MSEYVDVDIIENGKVIGKTKILKKTEEPEEQKIKLEKENAELKKKIGIYQKGMYDEIEKRDRKLTKATEIIKALLKTPRTVYRRDEDGEVVPYESMAYARLKEQAEQFLKGENIILEDAQAGNSPFDADEVFHKEMKTYPDEKVK